MLHNKSSSEYFSLPGRKSTNGFQAILEKHDVYQYNCPYDIDSSHWKDMSSDEYKGSFFKRDSKF